MLSCISFFHSFSYVVGAPDTSITLISPPSLELSSMLTMFFLDEIVDYGSIDEVMSSYDYVKELLHIVIS